MMKHDVSIFYTLLSFMRVVPTAHNMYLLSFLKGCNVKKLNLHRLLILLHIQYYNYKIPNGVHFLIFHVLKACMNFSLIRHVPTM